MTLGRLTTRKDVDKALDKIEIKGLKFSTVEAGKLNKATLIALYVSNKELKLTTILGLLGREHKQLTTGFPETRSRNISPTHHPTTALATTANVSFFPVEQWKQQICVAGQGNCTKRNEYK